MGENAAYRKRKTKNKRYQLNSSHDSRGQPPPGQDSGAPRQGRRRKRKRTKNPEGRGNPPQSAAIQDKRYKKRRIGVERAWKPSFAARLDPSLAALSQHGPLGGKEQGQEQPGLGTDIAPKTPSSRQQKTAEKKGGAETKIHGQRKD